jgi:hypothetical protein
MALFGGQFKGKCRNCAKIGHNPSSAKIVQTAIVEITAIIQLEEFIAHTQAGTCETELLQIEKELYSWQQYHSNSNNNGNCDRENYDSQDMVFAATSNTEKFIDDIWMCDSGACGHYCISDKGLFNVK